MIDVHMIVYDEPQWQIDRCLESLKDEPIILHQVQGIKEWPPTAGRALGYSKGTAPYVSYVDPDDYIVPGAFTKLLTAIQNSDYDAAHGWEAVIRNGVQCNTIKSAHHAFILKRGLPVDYSLEWRIFIYPPRIMKVITIDEILYCRDLGDR